MTMETHIDQNTYFHDQYNVYTMHIQRKCHVVANGFTKNAFWISEFQTYNEHTILRFFDPLYN